jgi:WS/DGAT/MGAT family acyltransferase
MDAAFLLAETRATPLHVAGLHIYKVPHGAPAHFTSRLYAWLRSCPVTAEPFNYQLAGGLAGKLLPSWEVRQDVDLDYHLRFSALPQPGGERELGVLVSRLHSIPMDLARPLWEYYLIEGLEGGRFAVYLKLHHALVDGIRAMRLTTLSDDGPGGFAPPIWAADLGDEFAHRPASTPLLERVTSLVREQVTALPSLARGLATTVKAAAQVADDPDLASMTEAPRMMFNVRIGAQRRVTTQRVGLDRIKAIGRAAGGTVNDVVLAVCSGALRRYLLALRKLPDRSLVAAMPVALARDDDDTGGNAVSSVLVRLGTDCADVRQRFEVIRRSSLAGKAHLKQMTRTAVLQYTMITAAPVLVEAWLPRAVAGVPPIFNVLISNVPGPQHKLHFHGAELQAWYPVSQIGQGQALNITVLSYAGELAFGLVACPERVPGVQRLANHLIEALEELEACFLAQPAPPRARRAVAKRPPRAVRSKSSRMNRVVAGS